MEGAHRCTSSREACGWSGDRWNFVIAATGDGRGTWYTKLRGKATCSTFPHARKNGLLSLSTLESDDCFSGSEVGVVASRFS